MGLSILAGGLSFVGAANAVDLILNGSFEAITGGTPNSYNSITDGTLAGWDGVVSGISYGFNYFSGPVIPASETPGLVYSWNQDGDATHSTGYTNALTQTVNLTNGVSAANIDAGVGQYTFSAWMSSYTLQNDQPYLTVRFFDASTNQVGGTAVFDRVHSLFFTSFAVDFPSPSVFNDITQLHDWAKYVKTAGIPKLARTAVVGIQHSPNGTLTGRPDTYTDLVKLDVTVANTRPSIESATPLDSGLPDRIPGTTPSVTVTLRDGFYAVNTNTIAFSFDGTNQTAVISKVGAVTTIQYTIPGLLASGSTHSYQVVYSDNSPGLPQTNLLSFTVLNYATLPTAYAIPAGAGVTRGFTYRTVSASTQVATNIPSTIARAKAQLVGTLTNLDTSMPYTNEAALGPNADGSFNISTVLNFDDTGTTVDNFTNDVTFPGLDVPGNNWFSTEGLLYLDLPPGYYRFGVNSDDGFEVNATPPQGVPGSPIVLGLFDNGRGAADTLFDFLVQTRGIYRFQVIYFQDKGLASCEFFSVTNLPTGGKILINDTNDFNAIKSYRVLKPRITSIVPSGPNMSIGWAYGIPPFQVQFKTNIIDTWSNLGSPTTNRTANVPIQPGAGFIRIFGQ
jgi:hypothetical protein